MYLSCIYHFLLLFSFLFSSIPSIRTTVPLPCSDDSQGAEEEKTGKWKNMDIGLVSIQQILLLSLLLLIFLPFLCLLFILGDLYSGGSGNPRLNNAQACFKWTLFAFNVLFLVSKRIYSYVLMSSIASCSHVLFFSLLCQIFGIVLISVGSYALNSTVAGIVGTTLPAGLIVLGVFIMLVALLGGISAYRESRAFLGFV